MQSPSPLRKLGRVKHSPIGAARHLGVEVGSTGSTSTDGAIVRSMVIPRPLSRARARALSASGFEPAPSYRVGCGTSRSKPLAERNSGVCALGHFRLSEQPLIRGRAGAERRAANPGRRCGTTISPPHSLFKLEIGRGGAVRQSAAARTSWPVVKPRLGSRSQNSGSAERTAP